MANPDFINFVFRWLDAWEIQELERMFAKHPPGREGEPMPTRAERRVAREKRQHVAEMTPEEMRRELLTCELTGLPNRRAFGEAGTATAVAMCDLDGLKALNQYGYEVGNAVLQAKADALRKAGLEAYHDKGDEFLCRGSRIKELLPKLKRARAILRGHTIVVKRSDGSTLRIKGADFSYGVGKNIDEAELGLRRHKAVRYDKGEITRGELRNISIEIEHSDPEFRLSPAAASASCDKQTKATASSSLLR
jgi:GGDEF domain-containing protein